MPRTKIKESATFSMRMDTNIKERLEQFCKESGMSKTVAVERAITMLTDDWDKKKEALALFERKDYKL